MTAKTHEPRLVAGEVIAPPPVPAAPAFDAGAPTIAADSAFGGFGATAPVASRAGSLLFWSTAALAVFLAFWVAGGGRVVLDAVATSIRSAPAQALAIERVTSRIERLAGGEVLLVEGRVRNGGERPLAVPAIVIAVESEGAATMRYVLRSPGLELASGGTHSFSSRLDAPARTVASVTLTFEEGNR